MTDISWAEAQRRTFARANGYCEYCRTSIANTGQAMHVEHIDPNGGDALDNLCLSCANCNLSKHTATTANDPDTGVSLPLYNPRTQSWQTHFAWSNDATEIIGLTAIGRATASRLKFNRPRAVLARQRWIIGGFHPPT